MSVRRASSGKSSSGSPAAPAFSSSSSWKGLQSAHRTLGGSGVDGPTSEGTPDSGATRVELAGPPATLA
eukprot:10541487-Lingulodinium_polyedra.AAC.1